MEIFGYAVPLGDNIFVVVALVSLGLVFIIKGGDWFVDSASWFAEATGIPKFVVGATVVSFATTLPELLVSVRASVQNANDLAVGNAVGSVTANTALIMGISLALLPGVIDKKSFAFKGGLFLLSGVGLTVLSLKGYLPRWSAFVLWAIFIVFMVDSIIEGKKGADADEKTIVNNKELPKRIIFFLLGTAGIIFGAEFLVGGGTEIAKQLGISEKIIGFTVIAVGTSLPELITTLTAIRKKESSLSVGNIIGANIIDLTLILPICSILNKSGSLPVSASSLSFDFPFCIAVSAIVVIPTIFQGKFKRWQGFVILAAYIGYLLFLILNEAQVVML